MVSGIILAGGSSTRYGTGENKALVDLCGSPVLEYSLRVFLDSPLVDEVVLAAKAGEENDLQEIVNAVSPKKKVTIVTGGTDRAYSVQNTLEAAKGDMVLIHDGARPLVTASMLVDCLGALKEADGATIALPSSDTVKLSDSNDYVVSTSDRSHTWLIQTPQAFRREELLALHRSLTERKSVTDDCMLLERAGKRVKLVKGSSRNIKITTPEDHDLAEFYLKIC